ncbi:MAG: hypothetical protein ACPF97_05085, partial [Ilumatobacteraceae bacterium]
MNKSCEILLHRASTHYIPTQGGEMIKSKRIAVAAMAAVLALAGAACGSDDPVAEEPAAEEPAAEEPAAEEPAAEEEAAEEPAE